MSATTTATTTAEPAASQYRLTYLRVMKSEWLRFWTLKANLITLISICAAIILFGVLSAAAATGAVDAQNGGPPSSGSDPVSIVLSGGQLFGVLLIGVLGVLIGAREYSSGIIRVIIASVPRRLNVLTAKIAVFAIITAPAALIAILIAFFAGTALLDAAGHASVTLADDGVARAIIGTAGYLVGLGIAGICIGILLRSIGGGLATIIGGVLILPQIATGLLPDSWDTVLKFLPSNAATSFTSVTPPAVYLSSTAGAIVFVIWIIAVAAAAGAALRMRDV